MRVLFPCLLAILLAAPGSRVWADEDVETARVEIQLPRDGLCLEAPVDWVIDQYGHALLKLTRGKAVLWVYRAKPGDPAAAVRLNAEMRRSGSKAPEDKLPELQPWDVAGSTAAAFVSFETAAEERIHAAVDLPQGPGFDVEARYPRNAKDLREAVRAMLATLCVRPFVHSERHVDWRDGWTLDVPRTWTRERDPDGMARFRAAGPPPCGIRVHARAPEDADDAETAARAVLDAACARLQAKGLQVALDPKTLRASEVSLKGGVSARRLTVTARGTKGRAAGLQFQLEALTTADLRLLLACPGSDASVLDAGRKVALTLRKGKDPGSHVVPAAPQGFKRSGAPPVQFVLPAGWRFEEVENPMRLGTVEVPGSPGLTVVLYWFGAGKGGSLASNLARWKSQVRGDSSPKEETIEVGPHVRATILDTHGMYVADMQPGAGHPDVEHGQRVLATFLAVPHGPLFMKLIGPVEAVGKIAPDFGTWIRSFRVVTPGAESK